MTDRLLAAPPLVVSGLTFAGVTLQDWVYILTIIWLVSQLVWFVFDKFGKCHDKDDHDG